MTIKAEQAEKICMWRQPLCVPHFENLRSYALLKQGHPIRRAVPHDLPESLTAVHDLSGYHHGDTEATEKRSPFP